ncbi:MarP family serine protease [Pseudonocardia kujensis]|uniref:MarP family serine protease n=1 Tax=Pseudonocardia kujensis TaxID=1128675 RepID=UPI001E356DA5|nr:MarP family serine protease [Pseudonocardia kujensis]MCE0767267.1 MarP family serine protease [Pseudonocardia kujensis]
MSWVDVAVVVLALIAAVSGWRHGMAVALLSFVGVLGGAIIGVRVAPLLVADIQAQTTRIIVSIVVVVLLVALGETLGVYLGRKIRDRIRGERFLAVDSTLGAIVQGVTVVLAAWLVALPLASASFPGLASSVRQSEVLKGVDSVMPDQARSLPAELRTLLDRSGFPDVLSPFQATPIQQVGPPDPALLNLPIVSEVRGSVLKVHGRAPSCQRQLEGTGFVVAPHRVMTNAHVVAGTTDTTVEVTTSSNRIRQLDARVVSYDPEVDVAVLAVPDLDADPLNFAPAAATPGDDAIILGYPLDGPYTISAGKVRDRIQLRGPDIYDANTVTRDVYTVRAKVQSGNSGGPMIAPNGEVLGVVFGAALDDSETGFVLTAQQVAKALGTAPGLTRSVDTGSCAA